MGNKRIRDAAGSTKYIQAVGAGTDADPFVDATGYDFTLATSAARTPTAGTNGTAVELNGRVKDLIIVCEFTVKATDVGDTCDVYVDCLIGSTWLNAIHFTQALGNGTDSQIEFAKLGSAVTGAATVTATADATSGAVRPSMIGSQIRARWVIVNSGTADASFTFSVTGYGV
jgi:hypothetical protein